MDSAVSRRKGAVLRAIVRDYVRTGQPVGSGRLAERYRPKVSAATIRNDMSALEDEGYLTQPYTSAGRVPTDRGYRWFVDNWPGPDWPNLNASAQEAIDGAFAIEFRGVDEALDSISWLLSEVTESAAVAVAPPAPPKKLRRLDLFRRDPRRATLLLIAEDGEVEQGVVEFRKVKTEGRLAALARSINPKVEGVSFDDLAAKVASLQPEGSGREAPNSDHAVISMEVKRVIAAGSAERIFRGGTANILSPEKFADIGVAHEIVDALENPLALSDLLKAARGAGAVLVFIGKEVPVEQMRGCAAVFAPYLSKSGEKGSVGVIGPTRMDYPRTISAVGTVARSLSRVFEN